MLSSEKAPRRHWGAPLATPPGSAAVCRRVSMRPVIPQRGGSWTAALAMQARRLSGSAASTSSACRHSSAHRQRPAQRAVGENGEDFIELTYSAEVMPPGGAQLCWYRPCHLKASQAGTTPNFGPPSVRTSTHRTHLHTFTATRKFSARRAAWRVRRDNLGRRGSAGRRG